MEYLFPHISAKPLFTLFIFLFKLSNCGTIPETTIEFSSDSRGIANSVIDLEVWLDVFLLRISFAAVCCMVWSGLSSCKVAWTWSTTQLTLAPGNSWILTRYLCLTFLWGDNHIVSWAYCLLECMQFWVFELLLVLLLLFLSFSSRSLLLCGPHSFELFESPLSLKILFFYVFSFF